jgi:hypothetical protein
MHCQLAALIRVRIAMRGESLQGEWIRLEGF